MISHEDQLPLKDTLEGNKELRMYLLFSTRICGESVKLLALSCFS
jgi:hypothetical protein